MLLIFISTFKNFIFYNTTIFLLIKWCEVFKFLRAIFEFTMMFWYIIFVLITLEVPSLLTTYISIAFCSF